MQNRLIKAVGKKGRWICLYSLWSRNANAPIKYFLCLKTEKPKSEHHNIMCRSACEEKLNGNGTEMRRSETLDSR